MRALSMADPCSRFIRYNKEHEILFFAFADSDYSLEESNSDSENQWERKDKNPFFS
jgi:hypothetical protein